MMETKQTTPHYKVPVPVIIQNLKDLPAVDKMKSKEDIIKILKESFNYVYCDTCKKEYCEECHRKYMNWEISDSYAEIVANKIIEEA